MEGSPEDSGLPTRTDTSYMIRYSVVIVYLIHYSVPLTGRSPSLQSQNTGRVTDCDGAGDVSISLPNVCCESITTKKHLVVPA